MTPDRIDLDREQWRAVWRLIRMRKRELAGVHAAEQDHEVVPYEIKVIAYPGFVRKP